MLVLVLEYMSSGDLHLILKAVPGQVEFESYRGHFYHAVYNKISPEELTIFTGCDCNILKAPPSLRVFSLILNPTSTLVPLRR